MMKTAKELIKERLTIKNGFHKGARITLTEAIAEELMEAYHAQFKQNKYCPNCGLDLSKLNNKKIT